MKIGGKCALVVEQLRALNNTGCNYFELHLDASMVVETYLGLNLKPFKEVMDELGMKCYAVHTPYSTLDGKDVAIGGIEEDYIRDTLPNILQISDVLFERKTGIIIYHLGCYVSTDVDAMVYNIGTERKKAMCGALSLLKDLSSAIGVYNSNYSIAIENVMPLDIRGNNVKLTVLGNGYDNKHLVDKLESEGYSNIVTLIDTCHLLATQYFLQKDIVIDALEDYKDTLGLIHLSFGKDIALGRRNHGLPFTVDNVDLLRGIIFKLNELDNDIPVTIEVLEESLTSSDSYNNYKDTLRLIREVCKDVDLEY